MNKTLFLLLFAIALSASEAVYTVDIDRSGSSAAVLSLEGTGSAALLLPPDAKNFRIVGGSFEIANQTAIVTTGKSGFTTFSFSTDLLTTKTPTGWKLEFSPPESAAVRIYMPAYSTIENSFPQPKKVSSADSRIFVELEYSRSVLVYYRLEEPLPEEKSDSLVIFAAAVVIAAAAIGVSLLLRSRPQKIVVETKNGVAIAEEKKPTLEITPGKKEMMETFNENDLKIVNYLVSCQGKSRRNELERKSGISKSSLAMALNRLEKRKIVEIDRTATTHFVKLSDYFLKL
jgi:uncharacterized membrane protein